MIWLNQAHVAFICCSSEVSELDQYKVSFPWSKTAEPNITLP